MQALWSLCIATCGRPGGLARLLESVAVQKLPEGLSLEVIVVDDDPTGSAAAVVETLGAFPHPLQYIALGGRNVALARNRSVEAARGAWLVFVDDDEVPAPDWLAAYWGALADCDADGLFGPVLPCLEPGGRPWLDAEIFFARPRHPTGTRLAPSDLRAGNACLERGLFEGRRFDPAFGAGGEDTDLFGRMLADGARLLWCDEAWVDEWVAAERRRLSWLSRRAFQGGAIHTRTTLRGRGGAARAAAALRACCVAAVCALALPFAAAAGRVHAARVWLRGCVQAGHLAALLGRGDAG